MVIFYTGLWVEEFKKVEYKGFSISGNNFQESFFEDLKAVHLEPQRILSIRPVLGYPHQKMIWNYEKGGENPLVEYIPFINHSLLKVISQGIGFLSLFLKNCILNQNTVLISYNLSHPQALFLYIAKVITKSHWVVLLADFPGVSRSHQPGILRSLAFKVEKFFLKKTDALILLNPHINPDFKLKTPFISYIPRPPLNVLHQLKEIIPQRRDRCIIFYGGRLDSVRGVHHLLDAFKSLPSESRAELWITGDGPFKDLVLETQKNHPHIKYFGKFADQSQVFELYNQVDALINPHETLTPESRTLFPSKLIEYFATGIPVISTKMCEMEQVFKMSLYLESNQPEKISETILLFETSDREKYLEEAQINKKMIHSGDIFRNQQNDLRKLLEKLK